MAGPGRTRISAAKRARRGQEPAHHTARVYQALATTPTSSTDLGTALGYPLGRTRQYLEQLAAAGLAHHRTAGWSRPPTDRRDTTGRTPGSAARGVSCTVPLRAVGGRL